MSDLCVVCGKDSDIGAHGIKDGVVYDEYYCEPCYNSDLKGRKVENEIDVRGRSTPENLEIRPSLPISGLGDEARFTAST